MILSSLHSQKRLVFFIWIFTVLSVSVFIPIGTSDDTTAQNTVNLTDNISHHTVLLLVSTDDKTPVYRLWRKGISDGLENTKGEKIDLVVDYLDAPRYDDDDYIRKLVELYQYKISRIHPDLIITLGWDALEVVQDVGSNITHDIPIISTRADKSVNFSQVIEVTSLSAYTSETISVALHLLPDTSHIYIIAGNGGEDRKDMEIARNQVVSMDLKVPVTYLTNLSLSELESTVAHLPDRSLIYYVHFQTDLDGTLYVPAEVLKILREKSNSPIFAGLDTYMGNGIVGGMIASSEKRGNLVAKTVVDIIHGKNHGNVSFSPSEYMEYMFDSREITRWGINPSLLPPNSTVLYKEESVFERYFLFILGMIFIIGIETFLIAGLLINRRERKRAEACLIESEERFRILVEQAPEAIVVLDIKSGLFTDANRNAERLFGYNRKELLLYGPQDFYLNDQSDSIDITLQIQESFDRAMKGEEVIAERIIRNSKGEIIPCEVRLVRLPSRQAGLIRASFIDITPHKQAEEVLELRVRERTLELQKTQEAFQQANIKLNLLSGITRHDILNAVTALLGYLEFSLDLSHEEQVRTYLKQCTYYTQMIQSQIEFTRVYDDIGTEAPAWQNLSDILEKVRGMFKTQIFFSFSVDRVEIYADPLFEKVFFTLIENTIRHGDNATEVRVSCEVNNAELTIRYEDNGVGVSLSDKQKIFIRGVGKNTGFGLFISQEILAITRLTIQENGQPGKGVRFEIVVPSGEYRFLSREFSKDNN